MDHELLDESDESNESDESLDITELFWRCIEKKKISKKTSKETLFEMEDIYKEKIEKLCNVTTEYFKKDPRNYPNNSRFYSRPGDCYDGIHMGSEHLYEFFDSIIMSGFEQFNKFIDNPFDGDIINYLRRDISCGNSSCLYFQPLLNINWYEMKNMPEEFTKYEPSIEFLNRIFDLIYDELDTIDK